MEQVNYLNKWNYFGAGLLLLTGAFLTSCQSPNQGEPAETALIVEPAVQETATAVLPTAEPTEEPIPVDNCLDCHTNKDLLIQTADPEEEVINENEGEG